MTAVLIWKFCASVFSEDVQNARPAWVSYDYLLKEYVTYVFDGQLLRKLCHGEKDTVEMEGPRGWSRLEWKTPHPKKFQWNLWHCNSYRPTNRVTLTQVFHESWLQGKCRKSGAH